MDKRKLPAAKTNKITMRVGKTARDHAAKRQARNADNKAKRASWQNSHDWKNGLKDFPWETVNGKRNRTVETGKNGSQIRRVYK